MELKTFLQCIGKKGTKTLAEKLGVHFLTLYHIAAKRFCASPALAIAIYKKTKGEISYRNLVGKAKSEEIWPSDMFKEIDDWKNKHD